MAGKVKPVPDGFHTATPYLIVKGAAKAIEFYKQAFGATELERMEMPDGKIAHAESSSIVPCSKRVKASSIADRGRADLSAALLR